MVRYDDTTSGALYATDTARSTTPLPDLSPDQAREIMASAERTVADLLANDSLAAATIASYRSAMRYWDAWHVAAFNEPLGLLLNPRTAVPSETVLAFIGHHTPIDGHVTTTAMPDQVAERLQRLGAVGSRRSERCGGDRLVMSLATLRHRLSALQACHRLAGLIPEFADDTRVRRAIRAVANRYAHAAPGLLRAPKTAIGRATLAALLATCDESAKGIRDAALIRVAFVTARRRAEIVSMRWSDLHPVQTAQWRWVVRSLKGRRASTADGELLSVPLVGNALMALLAWRSLCAQIDPGSTSSASSMPVWRRISPARRDESVSLGEPMRGYDVWKIIRTRARMAGLDPTQFGAHSLRSGAASTLLDEDVSISEAAKLLAHSKIETTRTYDHRPVSVSIVRKLDGRDLDGRGERDTR